MRRPAQAGDTVPTARSRNTESARKLADTVSPYVVQAQWIKYGTTLACKLNVAEIMELKQMWKDVREKCGPLTLYTKKLVD